MNRYILAPRRQSCGLLERRHSRLGLGQFRYARAEPKTVTERGAVEFRTIWLELDNRRKSRKREPIPKEVAAMQYHDGWKGTLPHKDVISYRHHRERKGNVVPKKAINVSSLCILNA